MRLDNLFFDVWRMLSKNKFSVILLILQVCISFTLLGSLFTQTYQTQNVAEAYDDTYRGKIYYQMSDCLNDEDYYEYLYDNGEGYAKLRKFVDSIRNNQALSYIMLNNQDVEIKEKYPDIFLSGYEDGMGGSYELEGEIWYPMKSLQVSQNFFAEFGIAVSKGHMFRNEDSIYTENSSIPILLGSEYMPYVSSGDILHGYYLCEPFRLQVIGFLDESTFFMTGMQRKWCL